MPELPEVEVVRCGVADYVSGRVISDVEILGQRVARRHLPGPADLAARLRGRTISAVRRRGKYLWCDLGDEALVIHLGMSGQLLVCEPDTPDQRHLHARLRFEPADVELRFVDQRTFGGLQLSPVDASGLPEPVWAIAPDPFDPTFDQSKVVARMRASASGIKRLLLNQRLLSGVGNIYADEALWAAGVHAVLDAATAVMAAAALDQGGTSFDALYVNVNGQSGYFARSLNAYGQEGRPCPRCDTPIRRERFMNRSSFSCPSCQRPPRRSAGLGPARGLAQASDGLRIKVRPNQARMNAVGLQLPRIGRDRRVPVGDDDVGVRIRHPLERRIVLGGAGHVEVEVYEHDHPSGAESIEGGANVLFLNPGVSPEREDDGPPDLVAGQRHLREPIGVASIRIPGK